MKPDIHQKNLATAFIFIALGIVAMVFSVAYKLGTAANMGPGYFPFALGAILTVLGIIVATQSLSIPSDKNSRISFKIKPVLMILSSVFIFGLSLEPLGLFASVMFLVIFSSMASDEFNLKEAVINTMALLLMVFIIFIYFLEFQLPLWPGFMFSHS
jgi:hypothetical protein